MRQRLKYSDSLFEYSPRRDPEAYQKHTFPDSCKQITMNVSEIPIFYPNIGMRVLLYLNILEKEINFKIGIDFINSGGLEKVEIRTRFQIDNPDCQTALLF